MNLFDPWRYRPFAQPVPPPTTEPDAAPLVCVQFAASWLPYVLGCIPALMASATWQGAPGDIDLAIQRAGNLLYLFTQDTCPMITDIRILNCELQVYYSELGWTTIGNLSDCALPGQMGPQGEPGLNGSDGSDGQDGQQGIQGIQGVPGQDGSDGSDGQDGQQGIQGVQGVPGQDGQDGQDGPQGIPGTDAVAPPPLITESGSDHEKQCCAIAEGTATWLTAKGESTVFTLKSAFDAGKSIADQVTDLLDAIPVFGPIVNALIDLAVDMAISGDFDDIIGFWSDPDFAQDLAEQLYCELRKYQTIGIPELTNALVVARDWAIHLPLGLPLLTAYGPAFGLFLQALDPAVVYKRAYVHFDERSDDCAAFLCDDCTVYDFSIDAQDWVGYPGPNYGAAVYSGGHWQEEHDIPDDAWHVIIQHGFAAPVTLSKLKAHFTFAGTISNNCQVCSLRIYNHLYALIGQVDCPNPFTTGYIEIDGSYTDVSVIEVHTGGYHGRAPCGGVESGAITIDSVEYCP